MKPSRPALVLLSLGTALCTAWMAWAGAALNTAAAPQGIVSFELARTEAQSAMILSSWDAHASSIAMLIQGVDFLYLFLYPAWFASVLWAISAGRGGAFGRATRAIGAAVLFAAPLDMVENYALIEQLLYGANESMAALAYWCAVPKFGLVFVAAFALAVSAVVRMLPEQR